MAYREPVEFPFAVSGQDKVVAALNQIGSVADKNASRSEAASRRVADAAINAERRILGAYQREADKRLSYGERVNNRMIRMAQDQANKIGQIERRAADRAAELDKRAADRKQKWIRDRVIGGALGSIGGRIVGAGLSGVSMATDAVFGAGKESMQLQEAANRISINARQSGQAAIDPTELRKDIEKVAIDNAGVKSADVAAGIRKYVTMTGDISTARANASTFAMASSATGTKMEDIAAVGASLGSRFDVTGSQEMAQSLAILTFQGKQGAFELEDMAAQFQRLAVAAASFDIGKGVDAIKTLGGFSQIARTGTGNARMATTAIENVFATIGQKADKWGKEGVKVTNADGSKRSIVDILSERIASAGGTDLTKKTSVLQKDFGKQGIRAINPMIVEFTNAFKSAGGGKAGQEAGRKAIVDFFKRMSETTGTVAELQRDAAQAQKDSSAQLTAAWEKLKAAIGNEAVPAFVAVVPSLVELMSLGIGPAVEGLKLLAGVSREVFGFLQDMGIIKGNKGPSPEKFNSALKELDKFDKELSEQGGPMTDEQEVKREALLAAVNAADAELYQPATGKMTADDFAREYAALTDPMEIARAASDGSTVDMVARGRQIAETLASNSGNYAYQVNAGGNADQQKLAQEFFEQQLAGGAATNSDNADKIQKAMEASATAADLVSKALERAASDAARINPLSDR